jgi:hypothetical protein
MIKQINEVSKGIQVQLADGRKGTIGEQESDGRVQLFLPHLEILSPRTLVKLVGEERRSSTARSSR